VRHRDAWRAHFVSSNATADMLAPERETGGQTVSRPCAFENQISVGSRTQSGRKVAATSAGDSKIAFDSQVLALLTTSEMLIEAVVELARGNMGVAPRVAAFLRLHWQAMLVPAGARQMCADFRNDK
jgi:hypothetical protein